MAKTAQTINDYLASLQHPGEDVLEAMLRAWILPE